MVLVGALAAVAQGAPITTHDVDIVHARTPDNLDRLMTALARLNARYRGRPASTPLAADRAALATPGHSLFMTDLGPLDCLGSIEMAWVSTSWSLVRSRSTWTVVRCGC
jgi:hypothetical protein